MTEYIDVREIHPDYEELPCRYEHCDNTRIVYNVTHGYTICEDCYDGPDMDKLLHNPVTVRL